MSKPGPTHYRRATHLLRYLKKTKDLGLRFTKVKEKQRNVLIDYADDDYAGCVDSRRCTTGFFFMLNGGPPVALQAAKHRGNVDNGGCVQPFNVRESSCVPQRTPESHDLRAEGAHYDLSG